MPKISKIQLPGVAGAYDIVDAGARELIASMAGTSYLLGKTSSPLSDGSTTNPILINGVSTQAYNGNTVISSDGLKEFVWSATVFRIYQKEGNESGGYWYTFIPSPSQSQAEDAMYVQKTVAWLEQYTSSNPMDQPLAAGAEYIKLEATSTEGYGQWIEFGDLSNIGDLAQYDKVNITSTAASGAVPAGKARVVSEVTIHPTPDATIKALRVTGATVSTDTVLKSDSSLNKSKYATSNITAFGTDVEVSKVSNTTKKLQTKAYSNIRTDLVDSNSKFTVLMPTFTVGSDETLQIGECYVKNAGGVVQTNPTTLCNIGTRSEVIAGQIGDIDGGSFATGQLVDVSTQQAGATIVDSISITPKTAATKSSDPSTSIKVITANTTSSTEAGTYVEIPTSINASTITTAKLTQQQGATAEISAYDVPVSFDADPTKVDIGAQPANN